MLPATIDKSPPAFADILWLTLLNTKGVFTGIITLYADEPGFNRISLLPAITMLLKLSVYIFSFAVENVNGTPLGILI